MGRKIPEVLVGDELDRLLAQPSTRYPTGKRNRALMAVMSDCGLRVSEALHLEMKDINFNTSKVKVHQGKGKRDRVVWASDRTLSWIQTWLEVRPPGKGVLFTTLKGAPLQPRYVGAMVKRYAVKAGLDQGIHPHSLRHTFATDLYSQTKDIRLTQKMLGHADLSTTMIYTHVIDDDAEAAMRSLRK